MDFNNRGAGQSQGSQGKVVSPNANVATSTFKKLTNYKDPGWLRIVTVALLFSLTILAISVAALFYYGNPSEGKFLASNKVQAVFLTNGQVYFGNIKETSPKYMDLENIYYLSTQSSQPNQNSSNNNNQQNNFSLVKLGCELHGPYDQMVISTSQVSFWENLRDDGQVVKAIKQWQQQNPNGQKCNDTTANSQTNSNSNATGNTNTDKKQ
jgi:hypothetical protein